MLEKSQAHCTIEAPELGKLALPLAAATLLLSFDLGNMIGLFLARALNPQASPWPPKARGPPLKGSMP